MVAIAVAVVLLALVVARALRRQSMCGWYRATHEQTCLALRHPRAEHRHVWTDDEYIYRRLIDAMPSVDAAI